MVFGRHREHGNKVPLTRGSDHGSISSVADDFGYITELESESESESELLPKVLITAWNSGIYWLYITSMCHNKYYILDGHFHIKKVKNDNQMDVLT